MDWTGGLYFGITLKWEYKQCTLDSSMPGYIQKQLQKYKHENPTKPQHSTYAVAPKKYGKAAHDTIPEDNNPITWQKSPHTRPSCGWDNPLVCTRHLFKGVNGPVHNSNIVVPSY